MSREEDHPAPEDRPSRSVEAFYQGIAAEILNPKAALFFLAFLPQFVNPGGSVVLQILLLGCISVAFNTTADLVVAGFAGSVGKWLRESVRFSSKPTPPPPRGRRSGSCRPRARRL